MTIADVLAGSPYIAYGYSYPHKTAYRTLTQPQRLRDVWAHEDKTGLFLYTHIPFCESRCGFCNLFTAANSSDLHASYLAALQKQAEEIREELGGGRFARFAIGGGTPTILDESELQQLLETMAWLGVRPESIPTSVEVSPATASRQKLTLLRSAGVRRISLGVQVFDEKEIRALGRRQSRADVHRTLALIRETGFPILNIDLIYGGDRQTVQSWLATLEEALIYAPEEMYLYPLYVRPLTGLGLLGQAWDDQRVAAYRAGRDFLKDQGYEQVSMRMFRARHAPDFETGPEYCCQTDGMVGLGAGARSYTEQLHYSSQYSIERKGTRRIISEYISTPAAEFGYAKHGFVMDGEERRRRYLTKALLRCQGLDRLAYQALFATECLMDYPDLQQLEGVGLADIDRDLIRLTESGLEKSDAIAPWLYSEQVRSLMESHAWR